MKNLNIYTGLMLAALSSTASAISIGGYELAALANNVTGSNGAFLNYSSATAADTISTTQLALDLTDTSAATYVLSMDSAAYVDMSFTGSNAIYNGTGNDLALFFAGDNDSFSIQINGSTPQTYNPVFTGFTVSDAFNTYNLTVALIDLDNFGLAGSLDALAEFRVFLGDATHPALSLAGGFYTQPMTSQIPLPLSALLFASGLSVFGLFKRQRKLG